MPTFLSDPSTALYAVLAVIVVVLGIVAARRQKKADAINFGGAAIILLAIYLIDQSFESPREASVRKIQEMGKATRDKKNDDVFKHVSESFRYKSIDKKGLRDKAKQFEGTFGGISEYDLARSSFKPIDDNTVEQGFRVKHNGNPEVHFYVIGTFKKDADGEWRLSTFKLFDPVNLNDEKEIPGL